MEVTDSEEIPDGSAALRTALSEAGLRVRAGGGPGTETLPGAGHLVFVDATEDSAYDTVRDAVAELGLGLVRMEQRRHRIAEVFQDAPDATDPSGHPEHAGPADQPAQVPDQTWLRQPRLRALSS